MTAVPLPEVPDCRVSGFATHEVMNQPGVLENYDAYCGDRPLVNAVRVFGAGWVAETLTHTGTLVGSERMRHLAHQANRHLPELRPHDRFGHRVGRISEA